MRIILSRLGFSIIACTLALSGAPGAWAAGGEVPPGSPTGESPYGGPPGREPAARSPVAGRRDPGSLQRRARKQDAAAARRAAQERRAGQERRARQEQLAQQRRDAQLAAAARAEARRAQRARGAPPAASETRLRPSEVLAVTRSGLSQGAIDALVARHRLSAIDVSQMTLTGEVWRLWRANDNRSTRALVLELSRERGIARVQPNFVYALAQNGSDAALPQYALQRLHAEGFDAGARGEGVRVAVVDSLIDDNHPDLKASVETKFDAVGAQSQPHNHGTAVAGTIAAHGAVRGIAPAARILAVRAFDAAAQGATLAILKGVDWAVAHGARVVNMSFAGPADPALARLLQAAIARNVLLIAASGNAGPKSPPLYPAADPGVIAVAASDTADSVYAGSVRGPHVRLAAPGVDVLLPAVDGKYDLQTGTSVAAGFVSGLAALVVQREPTINQDALRKLFLRTAQPLAAAGAANADIGLVNAQRAVERREKAGAGR